MPETFDVFLSYNSKDRPVVREIAVALRSRGLSVWLDEWEMVPAQPWQEALERVIETTKAAAVMFGDEGLGPWQNMEMRGCVSEFVKRRLPVLPVLLPGSPADPELPFFLQGFSWVDLRGGLTPEGIDRLQWGITGRRPGEAALGTGERKAPNAGPQENPRVSERRKAQLLLVAILVALGIAGLVYRMNQNSARPSQPISEETIPQEPTEKAPRIDGQPPPALSDSALVIESPLTVSPQTVALPQWIDLQQTLRSNRPGERVVATYRLDPKHEVWFRNESGRSVKELQRTFEVSPAGQRLQTRALVQKGPGSGPMETVQIRQTLTDSSGNQLSDRCILSLRAE